MNICFEYQYRDGANYKNFGEVIFKADAETLLEEIERKIRNELIGSEFFVAEKVKIPTLYFDGFDPEIDHTWHTFSAISWTHDGASIERSIDEFIRDLGNAK